MRSARTSDAELERRGSSITLGGDDYGIRYVSVGGSWRYDITSSDGTVLAHLGRALDCRGLPWRIVELRAGCDPVLAQHILARACEDKLVSGHTGRADAELVAVENGYVTVALEAGARVSMPCVDTESERAYTEALAVGATTVAVELRDGVPLRIESGNQSRKPHTYPPPPESERRMKSGV